MPTKKLESIRAILTKMVDRHVNSNVPTEDLLAQPLRAELFSAVQMEQHGKVLAASHQLSDAHLRDRLLDRLADNEMILRSTCNLLASAITLERQVTPAAEWLLDNFYLIEDQIRIAKKHLPKGYSKELPRLKSGPSAGSPRVYDIALETISHGDGRVDLEGLSRFVAAYQQINCLQLGELWAIPIMLRFALIENLRRVAARITADRHARELAEEWADQMIEVADRDPSTLILLVADMARSDPPMSSPFVSEIARRLQGQAPGLSLPLTWITQHLSETGLTIEFLIQAEAQQQAADQVSISNSIGSLRFLSSMDWREFVETMSAVETTLRKDFGQVYARMDFYTRDRYRHVVEWLSKHSKLSEVAVAERSIQLAQDAGQRYGGLDRRSHVGYYLVGDGLPELEQAVELQMAWLDKIREGSRRFPLAAYLGPVLALTTLFSYSLLGNAYQSGLDYAWLVLLGILVVISSSQLAVAISNWAAGLLAVPRLLPRMDFSDGIPADCRTLVVVPTLIFNTENIDSLCEELEVRYIANPDTHLQFCLLTDFADADTETLPEDQALLERAKANIEALNQKHPDEIGNEGRFLLLHRPRRRNEQEKIWMGYERKRGKLADLNAFLRGTAQDMFSLVVGDIEELGNVKYVITLDTDTQLSRDTARKFVETIAHPLNKGRYDETLKRVCEGYGILQPRVAVSLPGARASVYQKLFSGDSGIDPYTRTVSDVYQDLFQEGSFIGKGIYDVDLFERTMFDRFPENRILSHDLLEGCYARSGLLSDVQLHEDYPSRYSVDAQRRHRWIRGDWQVAAWLFKRVPLAKNPQTGAEVKQDNPLSSLSRWKLFDNLRRSMVQVSLVGLLLMGWMLLPNPWFWTRAVLGVIFIPAVIVAAMELLRKSDDVLLSQHLVASWRMSARQFSHALLNFILLPYEAYFSADAILRSLWRMNVSHRRMLEWNPYGRANGGQYQLVDSYRSMWISPALAIISTFFLLYLSPHALIIAAPILLLWLVAPAVVWWISTPAKMAETRLDQKQIEFLNKLARKTWSYFEVYVGSENNWLPPDNMQEQPVAVTARRTSPTNIGLSLLASLGAHDFGYITAKILLERTANTFATLNKLARYRGHFYNWYTTDTLEPLHPIYISSVDSGNLAGHLLVLAQGLSELPDQPVFDNRVFKGLLATCMVFQERADKANLDSILKTLAPIQEEIALHAVNFLFDLHEVDSVLKRLVSEADVLLTQCAQIDNEQVNWWSRALADQLHGTIAELDGLMPSIQWSSVPLGLQDILMHEKIPSLRELAGFGARVDFVMATLSGDDHPDLHPQDENKKFSDDVRDSSRRAAIRIVEAEKLAQQAIAFAQMDYEFLYDKTTNLLAIGYNLSDRRRDPSYYDLLASEARLYTFIGIAQGKLPQECWFALGRQMTLAGGDPVLVSWSGSMFEYLMPLLVMPNYPGTLLDQTYQTMLNRQIEYGDQRKVCWGMSESGYYAFDAHLNYQYRAFGVPGLGLKRGLVDDLVIAPYASMMGLMVNAEASCNNLQKLVEQGFEGRFGLYEAIDYTGARLARGQNHALVRSFMSHHQGMGFLSIAYLLLEHPMQKRFASYPVFQSTLLLLQEKIPKASAYYANTSELADMRTYANSQEMPIRVISRSNSPVPEIQLLSNGRYHVMLTSAGGGYSRWKDLAVTRWQEDITRDQWGSFCYVRDLADGSFWSTCYQPTEKQPDNYEVIFSEGRAEFRRSDRDLDLHTEIVISPEDDIELRRTHIVNRSRSRKAIDFTSYAEMALASPAADAAHLAFSKLFVETEILTQDSAIIGTRRPRSLGQQMPWMLHLMTVHDVDHSASKEVSFETDRMRFIGRGRNLAYPLSMLEKGSLSGSHGSVLDPIAAIRQKIVLEAGQTVVVDVVTGMTDMRDSALALIAKYRDRNLADRVFELAWTHSHVVLRQLNAQESDAQLYARLASHVIYANPLMRADAGVLSKNRRGQSGLWSYAISGDLPIVLLQIKKPENIDLVRQLVQAHALWRLKGLAVDLVIWNEDQASYRQVLHEQILGLIASGPEAQVVDRPGGIFVRHSDQMPAEDRVLMLSVARVVLSDASGTLAEQLARRRSSDIRIPSLISTRRPYEAIDNVAEVRQTALMQSLILYNGTGGFTSDGREYVIGSNAETMTPLPWVNVLANPQFGSVVSEAGTAYTWGQNAHEFRLTPWENDPVTDSGGEAYYLRDEETGQFWSPMLSPCFGDGTYLTRHGFGYSVFESTVYGIHTELWMYVAMDAPIKYALLKIRNESNTVRKLSATGYIEWVLGDQRPKTLMHVVTEPDVRTGALFARNSYNTEFCDRIAFFDVDATVRSFTCDRTEFIGRNGFLRNPAGMARARLSGKAGAGMDPCAVLQVPFELAPQQKREIVFMLGATGRRLEDVSSLIKDYRGATAAHTALEKVHAHWSHVLSAVQVKTPDPALDVIVNGWLMYQTISCRLWARSGYYQSGGAYGYRDQLQDTMAMVHTEPHLIREHLLLCASRQFIDGDVQHWWHPPSGRGVRTHCSDDYLWLPLATHRYITATGDIGILDEKATFLDGRQVNSDEDSYYDLPLVSAESADLYRHCVLAIQHGLRFGIHGLPLMGSCDWNDGMDKVGEHGKGESVWLAFFLYEVLMRFADIADIRVDVPFARQCRDEAEKLRLNIEANAWDGDWYRRAYFDDGTPLGSAENPECQIDSISQSWAVLSGAGNTERIKQAMQAVDHRLVKRDSKLIQLLTPPFSDSDLNPGYIRGYVPGVRENGGQYTHAAVWTAMAFAHMGNGARAWELLDMINPVNHAVTSEDVARYKVEPYVLAADVYAVAPHTGRGGWTWYTGSSGWLYRFIVESLLGLSRRQDKLAITPHLPDAWPSFELTYRYRDTLYKIMVSRSTANANVFPGEQTDILVVVDGEAQTINEIDLVDDKREHVVDVFILKSKLNIKNAISTVPDSQTE